MKLWQSPRGFSSVVQDGDHRPQRGKTKRETAGVTDAVGKRELTIEFEAIESLLTVRR
jgi:hypothetical protein